MTSAAASADTEDTGVTRIHFMLFAFVVVASPEKKWSKTKLRHKKEALNLNQNQEATADEENQLVGPPRELFPAE